MLIISNFPYIKGVTGTFRMTLLNSPLILNGLFELKHYKAFQNQMVVAVEISIIFYFCLHE